MVLLTLGYDLALHIPELEVIQAPGKENLVLLLKYLRFGKLIRTVGCDKFPRGTIVSHPTPTSFGKVFR